jgi:SufS family cysteine desulfurase
MSIPAPEAFPQKAAVGEEPFDTALIRRLANELFANLGPAEPPVSAPTTLAGIPSQLPVLKETPGPELGLPPGSSGHAGLPGGFPSPTSPSAPPVHPSVIEAEPEKSPRSQSVTTSGAHCPGSSDSYTFGEPRCSRQIPGTTPAHSKAINVLGETRSPQFVSPTIPAIETHAQPDYYFLRGSELGHTHLPWGTQTPEVSGFDVEGIRRDFPALHQKVNGRPLIWFDNAATTHKPQAVIDATASFYGRDNSNIHRAAHTLAARSTDLFEDGREKVRQFLGAADAKEIVFVRGATEAVNLVAQTFGRSKIGAGDEILLSQLEHHANIVPWQILAEQVGALLRVIPINDRGELLVEEIPRLLTSKTKLLAITHVSNALGTLNPVEEIIALAHGHGVPVLVDGAQSAPHLPINVQAMDADFFVFSGHKVFGPTGIGALYGKSHLLAAMPPWQGGGHMIKDVTFAKTTYNRPPEKFEAGTPDIAGVVGLGAAIDYVTAAGIPAIAAYEHALLEYATSALSSVPGLRPIGTAASKASVFGFVIPGVENSRIAKHLDQHGIAVRAGHHCAMPAVRHFGVEGTVRPSLAFYNTFSEIDLLVEALHKLR